MMITVMSAKGTEMIIKLMKTVIGFVCAIVVCIILTTGKMDIGLEMISYKRTES